MKKESIGKPWEFSYAVEYRSKAVADALRAPIRTILEAVAVLRGIDFLSNELHQVETSLHYSEEKSPDSGPIDLLYFRSKPQSTMTSKEFRTLMELIFRGREWVDSSSDFAVYLRKPQAEDPWKNILD